MVDITMGSYGNLQPDLTTVTIFFVVLLLTYYLLSSRRQLPPGPLAYPLVGSVGFVRKLGRGKPHVVLAEESRKYGGVMSVWIGPDLMVFLHGFDTIKRALVQLSPALNNRPNWLPMVEQSMRYGKGVSWQNEKPWKVTRKFTMHTLREFGVGKLSQEEKVLAEVKALSDVLGHSDGQPTAMASLLQTAVSNVICHVVFGQRFDYSDKKFQRVLHNFEINLSGQGFISAINFLPKFLHRFFQKENAVMKARRQAITEIREFIFEKIQEHRETYTPSEIRDFVDMYIEVEKGGNVQSDDAVFNSSNMYKVIYDLFIAGSETTSTALEWCFLYMIEYPDVQKKCQALIDQECGSRDVRWSDRSKMPFVESTIEEILRLSSILPLSVPRTCLQDTTIDGYTIPAKTVILPNLYSANTDPQYWDEPHVFKPARFLGDEGSLVRKEAFSTFSIGSRNCLGENLARMELFLIFTSLLQKFSFHREDESKRNPIQIRPGSVVTLHPVPYKVRAVERRA